MKKAYIGGALTHAGDRQKNIYEQIAVLCKKCSIDAYVPHLGGTDPAKNPEVTPLDVWKKNHDIIENADYVIAYVGEPSLGTGAELEIARIAEVKTIIWWFVGERVSRMSLGNPGISDKIEAENIEDLLGELEKTLLK